MTLSAAEKQAAASAKQIAEEHQGVVDHKKSDLPAQFAKAQAHVGMFPQMPATMSSASPTSQTLANSLWTSMSTPGGTSVTEGQPVCV